MLQRHRSRQAIYDAAQIGKKLNLLPGAWTQGFQFSRNEAGISMKTKERLEEIVDVARMS